MAKTMTTSNTVVNPGKVKPQTSVKVEWGKSKFHEEGDVSYLHPVQAEKLKKLGKLKIVGEPTEPKKEEV